ncbi:MAG TPA: flagellar biosynthesis regulator FlaF [Xanthobacteraceae bacterium]|nr:flagellar biosynthesis regulator FlaF [Xanthobacteraceae bacterium]
MRNAAQAYGKIAKETAPPRELEAQLLLGAAARLQAVYEGWEAKRSELDDALLYNRKLWSIFLTSVTRADNPLPREIRQNIANLGVFVLSQTIEIAAERRRERLLPLISINREIAAGLLARAA